MRIALIHHQFVPRGGMEKYLIEFAAHLKMAGHELHLVTSDISSKMVEALGATVHRVPVIRGSPLIRMWQFEKEASRAVIDLPVDVTIGFGRTTRHDLHRAGGGCHRIYSELLSPFKRWGLKNRLELNLERRLYTEGHTKKFIVNSTMVAAQLREVYDVKPERIEVIHTAVDTTRFKPAERRAELRADLLQALRAPDRPIFLFVSLSHKRKGLDVLLDIWKDVNAELWIVGKPLTFPYRVKVARHQLQDRVRLLGQPQNIGVYYQAADWFIHPTLYDACANTVLQSMASGLPGIISTRDGATDFVRDGENGLIMKEPQNPASVHELVKRALTTDEATRVRMGAAAREAMLPLTWQKHLGEWMRIVAQVSPRPK
jgi:glycosyltransferase involved in cell wall biosynthesis